MSPPNFSAPKLQLYLAEWYTPNDPTFYRPRLKYLRTFPHNMNQEQSITEPREPQTHNLYEAWSSRHAASAKLIFSAKPLIGNIIRSLACYLFFPFQIILQRKCCILLDKANCVTLIFTRNCNPYAIGLLSLNSTFHRIKKKFP